MKTQKYICTSKGGVPLFFYELTDNPEEITMTFKCSIPRNIISNKDIERNIRCLEERAVRGEPREYLSNQLFKYIKKLPGIEEYYLNHEE